MPKSSQSAINLIIAEEDSDEAYYAAHYTGFEWPGGSSGPTIGIGYDCGYVTKDGLRADWSGYISDDAIAAILPACGLTGSTAAGFVARHKRAIAITWAQAIAEFSGRELPKWEAIVADRLPNSDALSGDSFGAITSLTYNRGAQGYDSMGARFVEMRAIKAHMIAKEFDKIPAEFLSMRRLWPRGGDLWRRRGHEAALFQKGLGTAPQKG